LALPTETPQEELTIEKLVYGGDGLARVGGRVVLTPFVLPGERVRAEVVRAKNDLQRGKLIKILEAVSARVEPACPYFGRCGGCQYQHAEYAVQLEQKRDILREVLRRVGKIEYSGDIEIAASEPFEYRNRAQLHIQDGTVGYFEAGSRALCPIERCPISSPTLNQAIGKLARDLPRYRGFTAAVELFTNEADLQVNLLDRIPGSVRPLFAELGASGPIEYGWFRVSRHSFFQVNRFLVDRLVEVALGDSYGTTSLDLYAGVGLFSLALAGRFRQVTAVESAASASRDLAFNVERSGLPVVCENETAEAHLTRLTDPPDLIVLDPPRAGLGKIVLAELIRLRSPALTIVACDPATLARDLSVLLNAGYRVAGMTLVDLFPQTAHLETVVHLLLTSN
jgi:23S rRNA (uracil1939-C5)-methyltransferase